MGQASQGSRRMRRIDAHRRPKRDAAALSGDGLADNLDRGVLSLLQSDSRMPIVQIATRLGVASLTVRRRLERLKHNGIVQFITAVDPEKLGYRVSVLIGLQVDLKKAEQVSKALAGLESITYVSAVMGSYDFVLFGVFRAEDDLYSFLTRELAKIDGVQRTETLRVLKVFKRVVTWGVVHADSSD